MTYDLRDRMEKLEEIRASYQQLPEDDKDITQFLKDFYERQDARFDAVKRRKNDRTHDQGKRFRMAQRIHEQARNTKQMPLEQLTREVMTMRDAGKQIMLDVDVYTSRALDEEPQYHDAHEPDELDAKPQRRSVTFIYAVQRAGEFFHYTTRTRIGFQEQETALAQEVARFNEEGVRARRFAYRTDGR